MKHIKTDSLTYSKTGEHILTYIGQGVKLTGFGFNKNKMDEFSYIDIIGQLKTSLYRGQESIDFSIKEVVESK